MEQLNDTRHIRRRLIARHSPTKQVIRQRLGDELGFVLREPDGANYALLLQLLCRVSVVLTLKR